MYNKSVIIEIKNNYNNNILWLIAIIIYNYNDIPVSLARKKFYYFR